jgi:tetratricopeptide (TPR) repeat protein
VLTKQKLDVVKLYNQGMTLYLQRNFSEALVFFEKALALDPEDGPSEEYVKRCKAFIQTPPGPDWDGVFVMTTK